MRSNKNSINLLGERLKAIRKASGLSQEQIQYVTGINQSQIARFEAGSLAARIDHISLLAELFGMEDHELLQYRSPVPDTEILTKNVSRYLKSRNIDPAVFLKKSLVHLIETKLLPSKFFTSPRLAKEISEFLADKNGPMFTTSHISRTMDDFVRKGRIERLKTDKSKYQYRNKA